MEFSEQGREGWRHVRNVGSVGVWFQWDNKMHKIEPNQVMHLPQYIVDYLMGGGCTNYAPNTGVADRPGKLLEVLHEQEGSMEFLKSEARRKKEAAEKAADEARKAVRAAEEAARAADIASGAAKVIVETEKPKKDGR